MVRDAGDFDAGKEADAYGSGAAALVPYKGYGQGWRKGIPFVRSPITFSFRNEWSNSGCGYRN